ncbi:MAG: hypothetical protein CMA64_04230 [Euryarchaeota archaeon]|nr:hypothetical protein [Euryarchaeota archaeon]
MLVKLLKGLKNAVSPNYWAEKIGEKTGAYDKARNSKLATWASNLDGWMWWLWQLGVGLIFFVFIEIILNMFGMTLLPWG